MLPFRPRRGNCCWRLFFAALVNQRADAVFAFHPAFIFHKDTAPHEHVQGNRRGEKTFLDQLKETYFLQPKSDRLTDDHAWLLRSVSDPTRRECWSQGGQRTVRTQRTGWRTKRVSIPSRLTFTSTVTQQMYLSVCQREDGSQDREPGLIIFMVSSYRGQKLWLLLFIPFGTQET